MGLSFLYMLNAFLSAYQAYTLPVTENAARFVWTLTSIVWSQITLTEIKKDFFNK